jgi:hypothetical protein
MQPIKIEPTPDGARAILSMARTTAELTAHDIDRLIRDLAAVRAQMVPIHPAEPPDDAARVHRSDNLLWTVRPAADRAAIEFAMQHPGLGWSRMLLSRAQAEDLQTSIEFALAKLPDSR